jgi:hypothetical protein
MTSLCETIHEAVADNDLPLLYSLVTKNEFILLSSSKDEQGRHDGAFIVEIDDMEALLVFTENDIAKQFVEGANASAEDPEEIDGIYIEGPALIDYLPSDYAIMLDADCDNTLIIEPGIIRSLKQMAEEDDSDQPEG